MLKFLKQLLMFRLGQKATRGFAKSIGLGALSGLFGVIGGFKSVHRHS